MRATLAEARAARNLAWSEAAVYARRSSRAPVQRGVGLGEATEHDAGGQGVGLEGLADGGDGDLGGGLKGESVGAGGERGEREAGELVLAAEGAGPGVAGAQLGGSARAAASDSTSLDSLNGRSHAPYDAAA